MVKYEIIVKKYALALFNSIEQSSITSNVFAELNNLNSKIKQNKSVQKLLFNKYVPKKFKSVFFNTIFNEIKVSNLLKNFIMILIQRKRLYLLGKIEKCFKDMIDSHNGIIKLKIKLANELDQDSNDKIKEKLYKYLGYKKIKFDFIYDKSILGGMLIEKGSQMLDLSLLAKLKKIESIVKKI